MGYSDLADHGDRTVARVLASRVEKLGDATWVVAGGRHFSYRELDRLSNRLARGLSGLGVGKGDAVLLMLDDGIEMVLCWLALSKIGAMEVPINTQLKGNVLAHIVNDSGSAVIVLHPGFADRLADIRDRVEKLDKAVVAGAGRRGGSDNRGAGLEIECVDLESLYSPRADALDRAPSHFDLAAVMYTSGTTGPSKGVMTTHAHAYEYALGVVELLELSGTDVYYNPLPLFHIAGQWAAVYASLIAGASVVIGGRFSPERFWPDVGRHGCTCTFLLGAMANWLFRQPPAAADRDNPVERMLVVPLLPEIEEFKARFDVKVSTTWGSTEINVPTRSSFTLADNRTCGRVAEDRYEVRIVDENDTELPPGVPGEAVVRARAPWVLMAGYWNNPEATARAWRNQWVHSGDMLMKDEAGNLYFVDRIKDAIRRRGENISSVEVENEINAHPAVLECAVIPVESEHTEQDVMAVVVPKAGVEVEPRGLIEFLEPRLAAYMVPRYIEVVTALPKTATGKITKFALRERGVTSTTWDREALGSATRGS